MAKISVQSLLPARRSKIAAVDRSKVKAPVDRRLSWRFHTKQQAIVAEVRALLIEDGYASFTLRRVAERCKMALGNLQYYYPTRESLIVAFVRQWIQVETKQRELLKAKGLASKQLAARWTSDLFEYLVGSENGSLMVELWAMASHDATAREELAAWYAEERSYYGAVLLKINPLLTMEEAQSRARILSGMVEGLVPQFNRLRSDVGEMANVRKLIRETAMRLIDGVD